MRSYLKPSMGILEGVDAGTTAITSHKINHFEEYLSLLYTN